MDSLLFKISNQIHSESASQLFNSILLKTTKPQLSFISGLDALLYPGLSRGDIFELQGPTNSAKSQLLYFLTMSAILPATLPIQLAEELIDIVIGGKEKVVIFFSCDLKFDIRRLSTMLHSHLVGQLARTPDIDVHARPQLVDQLVKDCLTRRLIIFEPHSTLDLAVSLRNLPEWYKLANLDEEIGYVLIDGMSDFSFVDALAAEESKSLPPLSSPEPAMRHLVSALAHLRSTLSPIIFLTNYALRTYSITHRSKEGYPFYQSHLLSPWPLITSPPLPPNPLDPLDTLLPPLLPTSESPTIPIYHITLHAPNVDMIPKGCTLDRLIRTREAIRSYQVENGMESFVAVLRIQGGKEIGSWSFDVKSAGLES